MIQLPLNKPRQSGQAVSMAASLHDLPTPNHGRVTQTLLDT